MFVENKTMHRQFSNPVTKFLTHHAVIFSLLSVELLILLLVIFRNFSFDYLWYDESGQFWIAKGLHHDSAPLSPSGNISDVIDSNSHHNLDPGGFSILLYWWTKISDSIIWLRMLPFLFLCGISVCSAYLTNHFFKNRILTFLALFLPFTYPVLLNMGFEIRAYSMEVFFTMLLLILIEQLAKRLTPLRVLFSAIIMSIGMCSRYSAIIIAFAGSSYLIFLIIRQNISSKDKIILLICLIVPLLTTQFSIYHNALKHQNLHLGQLSYLQYLSNNWSYLIRPLNLLYMLVLLGLLFISIKQNKWLKTDAYRHLLYLCLSANALYIILSALGLHPWRIGSKGNISVNFLVLFSVFVLVIHFIKRLPKQLRLMKLTVVLICPVFIIVGYNRYLFPKHSESPYPRHDMHVSTAYHFEKIDSVKHQRIFVESWESPYVRYEFEYGNLKHLKHLYPERFTFGTGLPHYHFPKKRGQAITIDPPPTMDELLKYDLIISSELFDWSHHHNQHWQLIPGTKNFWEKRK